MPVPLILCRLKEDHSQTQMIGKTALFHFPDWEPVPEEEMTQEQRMIAAPESVSAEPGGGEASEEKPEDGGESEEKPETKTQTSRSRAKTTKSAQAGDKKDEE